MWSQLFDCRYQWQYFNSIQWCFTVYRIHKKKWSRQQNVRTTLSCAIPQKAGEVWDLAHDGSRIYEPHGWSLLSWPCRSLLRVRNILRTLRHVGGTRPSYHSRYAWWLAAASDHETIYVVRQVSYSTHIDSRMRLTRQTAETWSNELRDLERALKVKQKSNPPFSRLRRWEINWKQGESEGIFDIFKFSPGKLMSGLAHDQPGEDGTEPES